MKKLFTILALTATTLAADVQDEEMKELWSAWKDLHGKNYPEDEEFHRMTVFTNNHNKIKAHNDAGDSTYTLGLNQFSDLTANEFEAQYLGGSITQPSEDRRLESEGENKRFLGQTTSLPASVDWRTKGALNPIKNQKSCGGCWAFSTAGSLEALHFIKTGKLLSFSEQQLIDCDKSSSGCKSGHLPTAFSYAAEYGIEQESTYPFVVRDTACTYSSSKATKVNKGYSMVKSRDATALMEALVTQPISITIEANQNAFQHYKSGVITSGCGTSLNHAVMAVGYTTVNGVKAFIVRNSWGTGWGENGYVYISASGTANSGAGVCGLLSGPIYPTD